MTKIQHKKICKELIKTLFKKKTHNEILWDNLFVRFEDVSLFNFACQGTFLLV